MPNQKAWRRLLFVACLLGGFLVHVRAHAQPLNNDVVAPLRRVLAQEQDVAKRDQATQAQIATLADMRDMGRALCLLEWREDDVDSLLAAADRSNRKRLAARLLDTAKTILHAQNNERRLAALGLLCVVAERYPSFIDKVDIAGTLGPDLSSLALDEHVPFAAAAQALVELCPAAPVTIKTLQTLLASKQPARHALGAQGVLGMTRSAALSEATATRARSLAVTTAAVALAGSGLDDANASVRINCLQAMHQAASALNGILGQPHVHTLDSPDAGPRAVEEDWSDLKPLLLAFKAQAPALLRALADRDRKVQLLARQTLDELAVARQQLARYARDNGLMLAAAIDPGTAPGNIRPAGSADPLLEGLRVTLPGLAAGVADPDARNRLKAIDVLEKMGPAAAPAAPVLVHALGDDDHFVRWAAARAVGKIAPAAADRAVPALTNLLSDEDSDVRLAAVRSLGCYGALARRAWPRLVQVLRVGDADTRLATLKALEQVRSSSQAVPPVLWDLCADPDARVRQEAVDLLSQLAEPRKQSKGR